MKTIQRSLAIDQLREKLASLTDDEHSLCQMASRLGVYCGGFSQWTFAELKERYHWIVKHRPHITRDELEDLANRWQLARQFVKETPLACDTQARGEEGEKRVCYGWDNFTNAELARFYAELFGEKIGIEFDPPGAEEE